MQNGRLPLGHDWRAGPTRSMGTFAHQPTGDHARQQTCTGCHGHRLEGGLLDAVLCRGRDFFRLVFDFVSGLQCSFLSVVRKVVQARIDLMGHLAEHGFGLCYRLVHALREVSAQGGDGFGGAGSV